MFSVHTGRQDFSKWIHKHFLSFKLTIHFNHDSRLSPLQRITLCQRVWHHSWLVVIGANYFNGYCFCQPLSTPGTCSLNHFAYPSASYHAILYLCITLIIIALFLELFHTKPPSVKVSDNCGFRYTFHMFYFCTHNLLRVLDLSNLAWGQHSQFHSSDLYLDCTFAKITRRHKICQGKFFTCALIRLPTAEAYGTISVSHWFLEH